MDFHGSFFNIVLAAVIFSTFILIWVAVITFFFGLDRKRAEENNTPSEKSEIKSPVAGEC